METQTLLHQLVKQAFPDSIEDSTLNNYKTYFLRILNVRTGIQLMDESELQAEMTKMTNKSQAYRLQDCLNRLSKTRLRKKNELIHFLFRTSQLGQNNSYTNQTLDTLFKSQEISQINYSQTIPKKIIEESPKNNDQLNIIQQITDKGNVTLSITEKDLIKDLIFSIQGIESQFICYDPINDSFQVKKDIAISSASRKLLNVMCECGWLFKKIQTFTQSNYNSLVLQALQNSIKEELNEYYRLIAYFENLLAESTLTLRKMYMWLKQPMHHLVQINLVLSQILTNVQLGTTSSLVISILCRYSKHGCPQTSQLFSRILHQTTIPIVRFINQWIFDGSLSDQAQEFFIERNDSNKIQIRDSGELWKNEFKVNQDKIPYMISLNDSYKIFDTGRVINWLRKQKKFTQFNQNYDLITIDLLGTEQFSLFVDQVNKEYNKQLIQLIKPNFKITLNAIKRFLLLGQGEFIHTLMELLQTELNKPAQQCYRHTLLSILESAFKNVSQEVRLNVKLLEPSQNDTGWEIFCLDYTIDEPLNTIFNQKIMLSYYRIFNFLWRIKRVEFTLTQCWKMHQKFMAIPNQFQTIKKAIQLSYQMMNEMQHFIKNFYSYLMLEAIESSWKKFIDECDKIQDLDGLIKIHELFISDILDRSFLNTKGESTQKLLFKLFDYIFRFKSCQELLLSYAKDQISQTDNQQLQLKNLLNKQQNISRLNQNKNQDIIKSLLELRKQYRDQMFELLEKLKKEDRLKFLHFKLDFNEYYLGIQESKLFNQDLERFIEKCLPKVNEVQIQPNRVQSSKQLIQPQQPQQRTFNTNIEFQNEVRSVKEGLRLLDEQRRQQLQLKDQFSKSPLQKSPLLQIPPTMTEHEKRKNDEDLSSSDDD
ncbi:unnamed protein product [Paramecium primaurelia]|uniref:Gamma-tubulin complex component n=1 Tax=Paramecium primaurelia TaxID=5886 RepID=A0A8S1QIT4_PARPR|nr:unnamed protein product [Paramecium primaurelia]